MKNILLIMLAFLQAISCTFNSTEESNQSKKTNTKDSLSSISMIDSINALKKNEISSSNTISQENLIAIANKHFERFSPKFHKRDEAIIDQNAFTGDLNNDGKIEVVIFYIVGLDEPSTAYMGTGFALYENTGDTLRYMLNYNPDFRFSFNKISNNTIFISKDDFAETDPHCCPSLHEPMELKYSNGKITDGKSLKE
jgi:hypothetical protein